MNSIAHPLAAVAATAADMRYVALSVAFFALAAAFAWFCAKVR